MDILKMGAEMLMEKLGSSVNGDSMQAALASLLGDGSGNIDLAGLASKMMASGDLGNLVSSWLGDGDNEGISPASIMSLLGSGKVTEFASKIGVDVGSAANGLAEVVPEMVNKASSGGSLLDAVGGASGLMGMAKKFF